MSTDHVRDENGMITLEPGEVYETGLLPIDQIIGPARFKITAVVPLPAAVLSGRERSAE